MAQKSDRDRCMEAGMDEYLSKPLRAVELYATLDRVLARQGEANGMTCGSKCSNPSHVIADCPLQALSL